MANIVIAGAGSGFGRRLSLDILAHEALRGGRISLVDTNAEIRTFLDQKDQARK